MSLVIYNTVSQKKEPLQLREPGKVSVYVCGVTVYDHSHIGHARVFVAFDVIIRYLKQLGYDVNYVRNLTDIDDKIIARAIDNHETCEALTSRFIDSFQEDMNALYLAKPDHEPKATEYISQMIIMIQTLIEKGFAYSASNGDVYYSVSQFPHYGCLSHRNLDSLQVGARVEENIAKKHPLDFVLWKMAKENEPAWESPWGMGRPGWHIECSAMSTSLLGDTFDIHGGGFDLQFPHHENEIAQACAATGGDFAKHWMHVGFLQVNSEKMSKSLNNFFLIKDILKEYSPEVLRYFLLSGHYRSQLNFSEESLVQAKLALTRFYQALAGVVVSDSFNPSSYSERFSAAMNDDFNTPVALSVLFELTHELNHVKATDPTRAGLLAKELIHACNILGLLQSTPEDFLRGDISDLDVQQITALIDERAQARTEKNWAKADEIRAELLNLGVEIEDVPGKTTWKRST